MTQLHRNSVNQTIQPSINPVRKSTALKVALCIAATCALAACSSTASKGASGLNPVNWITPYRVDVIQGNFVSKEQVDVLKVGMTRAQVKEVLGTPLITSLFHEDRWDYVFTLQRQGVEPQAFKYTVFFKGDQLERFGGDAMPSNEDFIAKLANTRKFGKVPVLEATEEQLKAAQRPSAAASTASSSTALGITPPTQPVAYPPLESAPR